MGKTVMIAGGTGLVGTALTKHLTAKGNHVIILTRDPQKAKTKSEFGDEVSYAHWDVKKQIIDADAIGNADAIIHVAGAGVVAKPWTEAYKKEIVESRTSSSALIIKALQENKNKVTTVVSMSAMGWYGPDTVPPHPFTEDEPSAPGFLGETCQVWEDSITPVKALGKRLVICRAGIVLAKKGGALDEFKKPLKLRVAAVLGNGRQIVSWIHIDDLCRLYEYALIHEEISGVFNAVAPEKVTNKQLTLQLAKAMHGSAFITAYVPAFVLKIMMGQRSMEVLKSATISSEKMIKTGFRFQYPDLPTALKRLV